MKTLIITLIATFSAAASAQTCLDLTGSWSSFDGPPLKFEQEGCSKITKWSGYRNFGGFTVKRDYDFGGKAFCVDIQKVDKCESVKVDGGSIVFTFDFDATRQTARHGACKNRETRYTKRADGNLDVVYPNAKCEDGFAGDVNYIYVKVKGDRF